MDTFTWINVSSNISNQNLTWNFSNSSNVFSGSRILDGKRPEPRYGHSQFTLDSERILIIGGCGGPNKQFDDAWILHWPSDSNLNAYWERLLVRNIVNAPSQIYCIPFVQCCGNKLVTFGKARLPTCSTSSLVTNIDEKNAMTIHGMVKQKRMRVCSCADPILTKQNVEGILFLIRFI